MDSANSHKKIQITLSHINGSHAFFVLKCVMVLIKPQDNPECILAWGYLFILRVYFSTNYIIIFD